MTEHKQATRSLQQARRSEAREKALQLREEHRRMSKRRQLIIQIGSIVAVVAVIATIALVLSFGRAAKLEGPAPANMASDGIVLTGQDGVVTAVRTEPLEAGKDPIRWSGTQDGVPHVQLIVDFECPHCAEFEKTYGERIEEWLKAGRISLEIRPVSIVNDASTRTAAAAACVANYAPDSFLDFHKVVYAAGADPERDTAALAALAAAAGAGQSSVAECINDQRFEGWVGAATLRTRQNEAFREEGQRFGTPTVLIDGELLAAGQDFITAVQVHLSEKIEAQAQALANSLATEETASAK